MPPQSALASTTPDPVDNPQTSPGPLSSHPHTLSLRPPSWTLFAWAPQLAFFLPHWLGLLSLLCQRFFFFPSSKDRGVPGLGLGPLFISVYTPSTGNLKCHGLNDTLRVPKFVSPSPTFPSSPDLYTQLLL